MGVSIYATNSTDSFEMGGGGFFNLRKNIAYALDPKLGAVYEIIPFCHSKEDFADHDRRVNKVIADRGLEKDADILDFLYMGDCEGSISYRTCKKIYDLIKDIDFSGKCFQYAMISDNDYERFKAFLSECYSHRRKMRWS